MNAEGGQSLYRSPNAGSPRQLHDDAAHLILAGLELERRHAKVLLEDLREFIGSPGVVNDSYSNRAEVLCWRIGEHLKQMGENNER